MEQDTTKGANIKFPYGIGYFINCTIDHLYKSNAKMVYATVYEIPDAIGEFDICTFGCILLHLRDPFLALQRASSHAKEMIIITDRPNQVANEDNNNCIKHRTIRFLPDSSTC